MRAVWLMFPSLALGAGCLRSTEFHCTTNEQCGPNGTCQQSVGGYCSFPDSQCMQGRYGNSAGPYAGQCVEGGGGGDGGVDGPPIDAPAVACPTDFMMLAGAPAGSHVYKKLTTSQDWSTQHDVCTALGGKTYLAVPDDATELMGIAQVAQVAIFWVGLDDRNGDGMFTRASDGTVVPPPPTGFLPWAAGEPDGGNEQCVSAMSTTISDEKCGGGGSIPHPAVCECEPPP